VAKFSSKTITDEQAIYASSNGEAVRGESTSPVSAAVAGLQTNTGSDTAAGIYGESRGGGAGVAGVNSSAGPGGKSGPGGYFSSVQAEGIHAETTSIANAAVAGYQKNPNSTGAAIYGEHISGGLAAFFKGNVIVTGDISFPGADFAEDFTIGNEAAADPGTVMMLNGTGELVTCSRSYERKVVGVIAGAGSYRTGIVMDKQPEHAGRRQPVALVGKVFCKVDANYGPIEVGDLLTSSNTSGHAMKADDPARAFGAVLGKAMAPLDRGVGLIPILICLQ
jgi:hypothetical protein